MLDAFVTINIFFYHLKNEAKPGTEIVFLSCVWFTKSYFCLSTHTAGFSVSGAFLKAATVTLVFIRRETAAWLSLFLTLCLTLFLSFREHYTVTIRRSNAKDAEGSFCPRIVMLSSRCGIQATRCLSE